MSWSGNGNFKNLEGLPERFRVALADAGHLIGEELVRQAHNGILNTAKTGRVYPGLPNQSSAPGEYSANQSGDLLGSINYELHGIDYITFFARSGHAGYQEYGTSKMAPRPNLEMAIEESDEFILATLGEVVMRAMGGG